VNAEIKQAKWDAFCKDVRAIIGASDVPVCREYDSPGESPQIDDRLVAFNGVEDDGHETFWVDRNEPVWAFCKTARKPYDEIVVACCESAKRHGVFKEWSSDGDPEDHAAGLALLARAVS